MSEPVQIDLGLLPNDQGERLDASRRSTSEEDGGSDALSEVKKARVREKALEILRKEFPAENLTTGATEVGGKEGEGRDRGEVNRVGSGEGRKERDVAEPNTLPSPRPLPKGEGLAQEEEEVIPARMLNQFVYCRRLFYYEFVEGVFVENADTARGTALHQKVDSGKGDLAVRATAAATKAKVGKKSAEDSATENTETTEKSKGAEEKKEEVIHSRSVQMGSTRLGVVAKMDLVEVRLGQANSDGADVGSLTKGNGGNEEGSETPHVVSYEGKVVEVCPVDYKAGAPKVTSETDGPEIWDADKMQLGMQALILRDNGFVCNEGIIYYRATKQRVRLAVTVELEAWICQKINEARATMKGPMPAPLLNSPKCAGCSLAPVCLPDETRMLANGAVDEDEADRGLTGPRRLMAARYDARALYLNTPGLRVGCKDEVLQVKDREKLVDEFRMRDVGHVALFGNIQVSTQAVQALCEKEIPITYFSMGGWFYGITRGHGLKNVFLRMEQFRQAGNAQTSLALAKRFVNGKIRNHRTMIMRNHVEPPAPAILKLKRAADDALEAATIEELLGIEGGAASLYFQNFNGMIKIGDDGLEPMNRDEGLQFNFERRNRRPPTDPVNAMLSMAYSLLSKDCAIATLAVGFDPYVGFYHQPRFGRPALALDLMEEFRPLIAESVVLNCINNRIITVKDFVRAGSAVNLNAGGRKRFFQAYEQRMSSLVTHPLFDYKVSYRRALELQARLLGKALTGEILEYVPMLTR